MNAYIDSSVLLRLVFAEPGLLSSWGQITSPVASELIRVECLRTIDRLSLSIRLDDEVIAERRNAILQLLSTFDLVPVTTAILDRAAEPFPTAVGTLDAIHLASALEVRSGRELPLVATHDRELGLAARSLGFEVDGT